MKKFLALAIAALLMLASVPAFAFTGFVSDPGVTESTHVEEALFNTEVRRVENDPIVTLDQWGDEVYEWTYMDNDAPIAVGDTVTLSCEIQVPETLPFDAELTEELQTAFILTPVVTDLEIVMAYGCDTNYECDYEHGYCYPLPGYGNAEINDFTLEVHPHLGSNIRVIVRFTAVAENLICAAISTVGQYRIPCHFSCGKLEKLDDNTYFIHYKDTFMVQDRGMKFIAENGHYADYYVYLNNHDYHRVAYSGGYKYVDVADGHGETEGVKYEALELAYNTYMNFFGFVDDNNSDVMTDGVFLYGAEPMIFSSAFRLGANEPEPTEPAPTEPVDPTEPVEPTEPVVDPTEPAEPTPPTTGAASFVGLGIAAIVSGAGVVLFKKKED